MREKERVHGESESERKRATGVKGWREGESKGGRREVGWREGEADAAGSSGRSLLGSHLWARCLACTPARPLAHLPYAG